MAEQKKKSSTNYKKIIHVDMDAYYAAIEQRDNPEYRNKPIAVGSSSRRGVVSTASYEARKYGIHSAMPSVTASRKCRQLIFVKPRFDVYKQVSQQIRSIFFSYTDLVEPLSLDEAYLDVTNNKKNMISATHIAQEIRDKIRSQTGLTASAGVSINKFVAKVASDRDKPDGLTVIPPEKVCSFIESLDISDFYGVGKVTEKKMKNIGINNGADLLEKSLPELIKLFGKAGIFYYNIARGIDEREVKATRIRKSIGAERTFKQDISQKSDLIERLQNINNILWGRMQKAEVTGKTITLKVKYHDFVNRSRSHTIKQYITEKNEIFKIARNLLIYSDLPERPIRLLGISVSNLNTASEHQRDAQICLDF
ncbi:MAG: DNA polymerase IV [Candidatus Marinimicrobia bacterium]|nr:DNA polymerase IV [Candidatus Neomarinimicrobiota bacterium]